MGSEPCRNKYRSNKHGKWAQHVGHVGKKIQKILGKYFLKRKILLDKIFVFFGVIDYRNNGQKH
jgi:hypothetical protein